jgi:hypothetical protein
MDGGTNALIAEAGGMPLPTPPLPCGARSAASTRSTGRQAGSKRRGQGLRPGLSNAFTASVQAAIQAARDERARADEGPTFDRLKSAHPEAPDEALREAVRAAVKLETDCGRYFSPNGPDFAASLLEAVRLARGENPGFSEATYRALLDHMAYLMK